MTRDQFFSAIDKRSGYLECSRRKARFDTFRTYGVRVSWWLLGPDGSSILAERFAERIDATHSTMVIQVEAERAEEFIELIDALIVAGKLSK